MLNFGWKKGLTKTNHPGIASQAQKISGDNNPSRLHGISAESIKKRIEKVKIGENEFYDRLKEKNNVIFCGSYNDYTKRVDQNLILKCRICEKEFVKSLVWYEQNGKCPYCFPKGHFWKGKKHSEESKKKIIDHFRLSYDEFKKQIELRSNDFDILTDYSDYQNQQHQQLDVKCKRCGFKSKRTLIALMNGTLCYSCYPRSEGQKEIIDFINELNVEYVISDREVIYPHEIDIYVPSLKFGIEYNGLYWHCESQKDNDYHYLKSKSAREREIKLFHIFSDEWILKNDIVKSMIRYQLNKIDNKIAARKCKLIKIDNEEGYDFFDKTHISGHTKAIVTFGLIYDNELVCCLSLKKPFQKRKYVDTIEIARFSVKLNTVVNGGFSRLFKAAKKWSFNNEFKKILSYADLRFGNGEIYKKNNFDLIGEVKGNYWYTDWKIRFPRQKFRARDDISERKVAKENNVFRIYGCGHNIYELNLN